MALTTSISVQDLVHDLRNAIGDKDVAFDDVSRLLYSTDASSYQIIPVSATFPRNADDVSAVHEIAEQFLYPIVRQHPNAIIVASGTS